MLAYATRRFLTALAMLPAIGAIVFVAANLSSNNELAEQVEKLRHGCGIDALRQGLCADVLDDVKAVK